MVSDFAFESGRENIDGRGSLSGEEGNERVLFGRMVLGARLEIVA
jgi:hypothetical protein